MKNKKNVLCCLLITLAEVIYFPIRAQQKNGVQNVVYQLDIKKKVNCFGRRQKISIMVLYYLIQAPLATLLPAGLHGALSV